MDFYLAIWVTSVIVLFTALIYSLAATGSAQQELIDRVAGIVVTLALLSWPVQLIWLIWRNVER